MKNPVSDPPKMQRKAVRAYRQLTEVIMLDHMRVNLWGELWFLVVWLWIVHLLRRESVAQWNFQYRRDATPILKAIHRDISGRSAF